MADFLNTLSAYVNGGCLSGTDKLLSALSADLPYWKNSGLIQKHFLGLKTAPTQFHEIQISVEPYTGKNKYVWEMKDYILASLKEDVSEVLVHGSLGTAEETPYSDFDALAIIRDEVFHSKKRIREVAMKLNAARKIMVAFDPLQHHGWFLLTEYCLKDYPVTYFPPELFSYSKSILHNTDRNISIRLAGKADFKRPVLSLCNSLTRKLTGTGWPKQIYAVKNLLSEFMLLPAFYVQARDSKGIFKKFSFAAARTDFTAEQWKVMDDVSAIRRDWKINLSEREKRELINRIPLKGKFLDESSVPGELKAKLTNELMDRMLILVNAVKEKTR